MLQEMLFGFGLQKALIGEWSTLGKQSFSVSVCAQETKWGIIRK